MTEIPATEIYPQMTQMNADKMNVAMRRLRNICLYNKQSGKYYYVCRFENTS